MKSLICSAALLAVLSACATPSAKIPAAYVSPVQYQSFTCKQIAEEAGRLSARTTQAQTVQDKKASKDAAGMAIGLLVLWPVLLMNEGDGAEAAEVARLKGEMEALESASIARKCNIKFQKPETPAPKGAQTKAPKTKAEEKPKG